MTAMMKLQPQLDGLVVVITGPGNLQGCLQVHIESSKTLMRIGSVEREGNEWRLDSVSFPNPESAVRALLAEMADLPLARPAVTLVPVAFAVAVALWLLARIWGAL